MKALDLFSTIYSLWRFPEATLRKIVVATRRNYTLLLAVLEGIGISFATLFVFKAGDIYTIDFSRLISAGAVLGVLISMPAIYVFCGTSYLTLRIQRTGATFKGFVSGIIYSLHPVAIAAVVLIPIQIAVFGSYLFSNNPPPQVINPASFYPLAFLDLVIAAAVVYFLVRLAKVLFGVRVLAVGLLMLFTGVFAVAGEVAKRILTQK